MVYRMVEGTGALKAALMVANLVVATVHGMVVSLA